MIGHGPTKDGIAIEGLRVALKACGRDVGFNDAREQGSADGAMGNGEVGPEGRCEAMHSAEARKESRGAHAREDFKDRDDANWMKHTLTWIDAKGGVAFDYRPVQMNTLTDEVKPIPPKARTY